MPPLELELLTALKMGLANLTVCQPPMYNKSNLIFSSCSLVLVRPRLAAPALLARERGACVNFLVAHLQFV